MKIEGRLGARSRDKGRTTEEPASQAGQDQRAWEDQFGARQDRTRGAWRGGAEGAKRAGSIRSCRPVCTPEGARNAGQCRSAVTSPDADPVLRGWDKGVQTSSVTSLKRGFGLYTG